MRYGVILAGGNGVRLRSANIPKQFLSIGGNVILRLVVDKFMLAKNIDKTIVVVPAAWASHSRDILKDEAYSGVDICRGGDTRQESLYNALKHIEENYGLDDGDIAVSHDAARPFVTLRIIDDNIALCEKYGATDTAIPATDTIACSGDSLYIDSIPARSAMYQGQTPQSFNIKTFIGIYERLSPEALSQATDAVKILRDNGVPVVIVRGEAFNIKVTTDFDLDYANYILKEGSSLKENRGD